MDTSRGLDTATVAPFCITLKSEQQTSHVDEPNDGPSAAAAMGVSRARLNCVGSLPNS
jgi:hypothetical protein